MTLPEQRPEKHENQSNAYMDKFPTHCLNKRI